MRADRRAASSASTTTFSAGRRAHAANSPSSITPTRSQLSSRSARNVQNARRSYAYASTVFGERSQSVNHDRYSSTGATGRRSGPMTVNDSTPLEGIDTRRTSNRRSPDSLTSLTATAARTYARRRTDPATARSPSPSPPPTAAPPTAAPGGRPLRLAYGSAPRPAAANPRRHYFVDVDDMLNIRRPPREAEPPPWTCLTLCVPLHIAPIPPVPRGAGTARRPRRRQREMERKPGRQAPERLDAPLSDPEDAPARGSRRASRTAPRHCDRAPGGSCGASRAGRESAALGRGRCLGRGPLRTQHPLGVVVNRPSVWPDR